MAEHGRRKRFVARDVARMLAHGVLTAGEAELLAGDLVLLPVPGPGHAERVEAVGARLASAYAGRGTVVAARPLRCADDSMPVPHLAVIREGADEPPRGHQALLAVELAPGRDAARVSARLSIYASGAVPAVWIVDGAARRLEMAWRPLVGEGRYAATRVLDAGERAPLPGLRDRIAVDALLV